MSFLLNVITLVKEFFSNNASSVTAVHFMPVNDIAPHSSSDEKSF